MKKLLLLPFLGLALFSCKQEEEEPFSEKLSIAMNYEDASGTWIYQSEATEITVRSGSYLDLSYGIGGEDGFGSSSITDIVQSFEYTVEDANGTNTCTLLDLADASNAANLAYPIRGDVKLTFTITSKDGETAVKGPFTITTSSKKEVINDGAGPSLDNFFVPIGPNVSYRPNYNKQSYVGLFINSYPILSYGSKDGKDYLISPSELGNYTPASEFYTANSCGWRTVKLMPYTGSLDLDELNYGTEVYGYDALDSITITNPVSAIEVVPGEKFLFETAEGLKGIGKFSSSQTAGVAAFVFECQR